MRFANTFLKMGVTLTFAGMVSGCETIDLRPKAVMQDNAPVETTTPAPVDAAPSAALPAAANATTSAQTPTTPVAPPVPAEPPVDAAAQKLFDEANHALKSGRLDEAERGYRSIIESNPELGGPHANLGVIYRNANKFTEALAEFNQAVRLSPKQPVYLNQLGITSRQMGQFDKARDAYEQALALDANYTPAILNLGIVYDMYLGESQRALELFVRYLALMPDGDATVSKWIAELKNRKPVSAAAAQKEKS